MESGKKLYITRETITGLNITAYESHYNAKFIGDFCTRDSQDKCWVNDCVAVFYQPHPRLDLGHSHYFGLLVKNGTVYIVNAESAFKEPITALVCDGELIYSRYRHDMRRGYSSKGNETYVDGGRDYTKLVGDFMNTEMVQFTIQDGEIVLC